jgi:excisionase family DNA binding protein
MSANSSFLTVHDAAARLGVHESTVRRYADRGLIRVKRLPSGVRRLRRADVDALATQMERGAAVPASIEDLVAPRVWESDEELEDFLALTYAERDRDR